MSGRIHTGTSGWHYDHWKGPFYPDKQAPAGMLGFYAEHFITVEINSSFYRLPDEKTLRGWADTVPDQFIFSVKASRYITHRKKLKDPEATLPKLLDRVRILGKKLGPVLFQLPPKWNFNAERLRDFLEALPRDLRFAFEFRDPSWFTEETETVLSGRNAAFCIYDFKGRQSPETVTADFVYVRLHGPDGAYQGRYGAAGLEKRAEKIRAWREEGKDVFCYFDNDEAGYAALDALELRGMLER